MIQNKAPLPMITLLLMISFASVNAVLFTPALPAIAAYFGVSAAKAQLTISWFLIGYALGQLVYGPIASRLGRKPALYIGISLQIISCLLCAAAGYFHLFSMLIVGRFFTALGAGVGLKMTFTLVNEHYEPKAASQKIAYLMLAFAITPALCVALGGFLTHSYGWQSCFYLAALYGVFLFFMVKQLPDLQDIKNLNAFRLSHLCHAYAVSFQNLKLMSGALLMGAGTTFIYAFAAVAPFVAINIDGMTSTEYGLANLLPPIGLVIGSLVSAQLSKYLSLNVIVGAGILITCLGTLLMGFATYQQLSPLISLFASVILIYFGICFITANASSIAMSKTIDKVHGSAVMNFINMGIATCVVLTLGLFPQTRLLLPFVYAAMCLIFFFAYAALVKS